MLSRWQMLAITWVLLAVAASLMARHGLAGHLGRQGIDTDSRVAIELDVAPAHDGQVARAPSF